jgi:hypothetical protein
VLSPPSQPKNAATISLLSMLQHWQGDVPCNSTNAGSHASIAAFKYLWDMLYTSSHYMRRMLASHHITGLADDLWRQHLMAMHSVNT